jgi:hypothetical protein
MTSSPGLSAQGGHYAAAHLGKSALADRSEVAACRGIEQGFFSLPFMPLLRSFAVLQLAFDCAHDNLLFLGG